MPYSSMARVREAVLVRRWLERKAGAGRTLAPREIGMVISWLEAEFESLWSDAVAGWLRDYLREHAEESVVQKGPVDEAMGEAVAAADGDIPPVSPQVMLEEFLEWSHGWRPAQTGVMVLTAHTSKGLEFDNVVICDADWLQGLRPTGG